jgi:hypothetical protein
MAIGAFSMAGAEVNLAQVPSTEGEPPSAIPNRDTVLKFNSDGTCKSFHGNTVICHLQPQGTTRDAMEHLHDDLAQRDFARKIAITPSYSYHMTIFPGANDQDRKRYGWPSDVSIDAPMEECNRIVGERMRAFRLNCELPIRVKIDETRTIANKRASTLRMIGADESEEKKLRVLRDRLVDVFRFRDLNHDKFAFHVTLGYQLQAFTPSEQNEYTELLRKHIPLINAANSVIEFGNPEYCTFPDMYRFDVQRLLST